MSTAFIPRFVILAALLLTGCQGVFEIHIERDPAQISPPLGNVAYIFGGDVWLLDLDRGQQTRLTRDGVNASPRISPDGNWIAYKKRDFLYVVDPQDGIEIQLTDLGTGEYAWSPQKPFLAIATTSGLMIWDGAIQQSYVLPVNLPVLDHLVWDANADWLAIDNRSGESRQVRKISPDGKSDQLLYRAPDVMHVPRLAGWSPDGQWMLLWIGSRAYAAEQDGLPLCFLATGGGDPACMPEQVLLKPDFVSWSGEGRVALIAGQGRESWVNKGLALTNPASPSIDWLVTSQEQAPIHPSWSPYGDHIAYSAGPALPIEAAYERRDTALRGRRIWVIDTVNHRRQQLTGDQRYRDERPLWSPDGEHILFARIGSEAASLWLMRADGSGLQQVVPELTPRPDPLGDFGLIDWSAWWDWFRP